MNKLRLLSILLTIGWVYSNDETEAFNTIELGIEYSQDITNNSFHNYYTGNNGAIISLKTPFYLGNIKASINILPFTAQKPPYIDFLSVNPNLFWFSKIIFLNKIHLSSGLGLGLYVFSFSNLSKDRCSPVNSDDNLSCDTKIYLYNIAAVTESEVNIAAYSELQYFLNNNTSINISINTYRIYTYKKIDLMNFSIGINRVFNTPNWLKLFLE